MIASYKTKFSADSIETRPGYRKVLACATYQLDSDTEHRNGDVSLLEFDENSEICKHDILETGGVLDLWWKDNRHLLAAKASGNLQAIVSSEGDELISGHELEVSDSILLTVDGTLNFIISSDTAGNIYKISFDNETLAISQEMNSVHGRGGWGSEVWGLAAHPTLPHLIYSGGDDCLLKCHDWRTADSPVFTSKHHTMGVCCISPDPTSDHAFISGSYDESVVLWDSRTMRNPVSECKVGGGVWRIKRDPENTSLLIAGMHSGFHIINLAEFQVTKTYTDHESLAYGADWLDDGLVATCSFYDNLVTVWQSDVSIAKK